MRPAVPLGSRRSARYRLVAPLAAVFVVMHSRWRRRACETRPGQFRHRVPLVAYSQMTRIYADRSVDCYGERIWQEMLPVAWSWHHAHQSTSEPKGPAGSSGLVHQWRCRPARGPDAEPVQPANHHRDPIALEVIIFRVTKKHRILIRAVYSLTAV